MEETIVVDAKSVKEADYKELVKEIINDLDNINYNAIKQLTEYILTGEIGYISSYRECRNRMTSINRRDLVEMMLKEYVKWESLDLIMDLELVE